MVQKKCELCKYTYKISTEQKRRPFKEWEMATGTGSECGDKLSNIGFLGFYNIWILAIITIMGWAIWKLKSINPGDEPVPLYVLMTLSVTMMLAIWCCICHQGIAILKKWKAHNSTAVVVVQEVTQV